MAEGEGSIGPDTDEQASSLNGQPVHDTTVPNDQDSEEEEEEGEDEEPRLKYANITRHLGPLHRNGDASSAFLVAGDKMIFGTHNGNIHVLSLPAFRLLRYYHGHSASVSAISMSPFPPPLPGPRSDAVQRLAPEISEQQESPSSSPAAKKSPRPGPVPNVPSNQIYIATASIDGNVCVQSLVDSKDVQLRNFGRPVLALALSPDYRSDRTYLSGGQAGSLVLTTGGQAGRSTNATTTGATAAASGWLGSIGIGANTGTDKVLHSGEGAISTISWSLSGKFILWVNEEGIKIMRSNLLLESAEAGSEWKRISHVGKPNRPGWEEMAAVWKARVEWIDRNSLETDNDPDERASSSDGALASTVNPRKHLEKTEEVIVGWGDTVWVIKVHPTASTTAGERNPGKAEIMTLMHFDDCTISGVSQYTPTMILVLAYMERRGGQTSRGENKDRKATRRSRQNALEPELRLVNIESREEVDADTLTISRFETLSASDYHLMVLPPVRIASFAQRGYLGAIGSGMETIGSGLYSGAEAVGHSVRDATLYPARMLGSNRVHSGSDSVRSGKSGGEKTASVKGSTYWTSWIPTFGFGKDNEEVNDVAATHGSKIFICSPFDCIVAVKRNLADRVQWLADVQRYEEAWNLIDRHPEAVGTVPEGSDATSPPPTPSKSSTFGRSESVLGQKPVHARQQASLAEFFAESSSVRSPSNLDHRSSSAEKEKRRIGEMWLNQLISANKWAEAGEVAGKVLNTTTSWEHWIWVFLQNKKFDEISPVIPTFQITPPLSSVIFEIILGHYLSDNKLRFKELLDQWPTDLFEINNISSAVEDQLKSEGSVKGSDDWRVLQECLAKLYLANGRYGEALRCYIRLQDADTALALVKEHHLVDAIVDDIPGFILLRVSPEILKKGSREQLDQLSSEPIKLLVDEAPTGVVEPDKVVKQLQESSYHLFLFFYLRALWRGEGTKDTPTAPRVGHLAALTSLAADEGKMLVEQFADTAVEIFSEYDRELLMDFLHSSTSYTFEKAVKICERQHYIEELVYLLSKTGQLKRALFLIIDELKDVSKAITFTKEQGDQGLWEDLLEYSMSRPRFISGLLSEAGMALDPITLVRRIPPGLEIEGLKDGLIKMIKEYDLQNSISSGAAKIFYSEVGVGTQELRQGRRRGIKFDVTSGAKKTRSRDTALDAPPSNVDTESPSRPEPHTGRCAACGEIFKGEAETETLVGFACGHVFHLSHLLQSWKGDAGPTTANLQDDDSVSDHHEDQLAALSSIFARSIDPKVTRARLLRDKIDAVTKGRGCSVCKAERGEVKADG